MRTQTSGLASALSRTSERLEAPSRRWRCCCLTEAYCRECAGQNCSKKAMAAMWYSSEPLPYLPIDLCASSSLEPTALILILTTARTIEHACLSNCKQHRIWPWWNPGSMQAVDVLADPAARIPQHWKLGGRMRLTCSADAGGVSLR